MFRPQKSRKQLKAIYVRSQYNTLIDATQYGSDQRAIARVDAAKVHTEMLSIDDEFKSDKQLGKRR